jgi:WD40 repeat protein
MISVRGAVFVAALVTLSCSTGGPEHCVTGASVACACAGGAPGYQVCLTNGTFAACVCNADGGGVDRVPEGGAGGPSATDAAVDANLRMDAPTPGLDTGPGVPSATDAPAVEAIPRVDAPAPGIEAGDQLQPVAPGPDAGAPTDGPTQMPACGSYGTEYEGSVALSPDGKLLAVYDVGGAVSLYRVADGSRAFQRFPFQDGSDETVAHPGGSPVFSPDGALLMVNGKLLSSTDGTTVRELVGAYESVFSPDGTLVAATMGYGATALWDFRTGARLRVTSCSGAGLKQFSGDGGLLRAGGTICRVADGVMVGTIAGNVVDRITPDFKEGLAIESGSVYAVRASDGVKLRLLGKSYGGVLLSHDGKFFANPAGPAIQLFSDGSVLRAFPDNPRAITPDDRFLLSWGAMSVRIRTVSTDDVLSVPLKPGALSRIIGLAYSRDGAVLASASAQLDSGEAHGAMELWRTSDGAQLWSAPVDAYSIALSGDGAVVGAVVTRGTFQKDTDLRSAKDGALVRTLADAPLLAFSPDGKLVATLLPHDSGATERPLGVRLWKAVDGTFVRDLKVEPTVNSRPPSRGSFSPDGQLFAADNYDPVNYRGVKLWRVSDGVEVPGFDTMNFPFVAFADSESVVTGPDGSSAAGDTVARWRIQDGGLLWKLIPARGSLGSRNYAVEGGKLAILTPSAGGEVVRLSDGRVLHRFPILQDSMYRGLGAPPPALALSPTAMDIATSGGYRSIRIWCVP